MEEQGHKYEEHFTKLIAKFKLITGTHVNSSFDPHFVEMNSMIENPLSISAEKRWFLNSVLLNPESNLHKAVFTLDKTAFAGQKSAER